MRKHKRTTGQALVEFAIAITLIFLLLSASVDLGLIFFTMQGLRNAAQEGAFFGSFPVVNVDSNGVPTGISIRENEIRNRVRFESGARGIGIYDLRDLSEDQIRISTLKDTNFDGYVSAGDPPCTQEDMLTARHCYIRVEVLYDYNAFFPFAPMLRDTVTLRASSILKIRSDMLLFRNS